MAWLNKPLMAITSPEQYMNSGVFGTFLAPDYSRWGAMEEYLLKSAANSEKSRADQNLYGARNYGDTAGIRFYVPIYYNLEYDIILGAMVQYARTGKRVYFDESDIAAWHFMDVDVLHSSNSQLNELGQHMHFTDHAKGETHAGHCTVEGLWHYYMLTGEPRAGEVATGIADWYSKIASWKNFLDFRDDEERTIGWSLKGLVSSYRATLKPALQTRRTDDRGAGHRWAGQGHRQLGPLPLSQRRQAPSDLSRRKTLDGWHHPAGNEALRRGIP